MKVLWLMTMLALAAPAAADEISSGSLELGGGIQFSSFGGDLYEEDGERLNVLDVAPQAAYFVTRGIAMGGTVQYHRLSIGSDNMTTFSIGPAVHAYFGPEGSRTFPFLSAGFLYSLVSSGGGGLDQADDFSLYRWEIGGGVMIRLVDHFAMKIGAVYTKDSIDFEDTTSEYNPIEGGSVGGDRFGVILGFSGFLY